jgi:hypothetical protein
VVAAIQQRRAIDVRTALKYLVFACGALLVGLAASSVGYSGSILHQIGHTLNHLGLEEHQGVAGVIVAIPKSLVSPYPWVFTRATHTWDRALYPGMWIWYALLPTAVMGLWRLRDRVELLLFALPVGTLLTVNALTAGFTFRQRSTVEPFLLLLVVAGADSWQRIARRAAVGYLLVALLATAQSHSLLTGGGIALVALVLALTAQQLPSAPLLTVALPSNLLGDLVIRIRKPTRRHTQAVLAHGLAAARAGAPQTAAVAGPHMSSLRLTTRAARWLAALRQAAPYLD